MIHSLIPMLAQEAASAAESSASITEAASTTTGPTVLGLGILLAIMVVLSALVLCAAYHIRTVTLALGFATTTAMWAIGYVAMMAPGLWLGELLFIATLAVPVLFGDASALALATALAAGLASPPDDLACSLACASTPMTPRFSPEKIDALAHAFPGVDVQRFRCKHGTPLRVRLDRGELDGARR